jgi:hypothetical protein
MARRRSLSGSLLGLLGTVVFALIAISVLPSLLRSTLLPEASGGPYSQADADSCHEAATSLASFPGKDASEAQHLGLGLDADVPTARSQAANAATKYAAMARAANAPASRGALDQVANALEASAAAYSSPMTVAEFRDEYRSDRTAIEGLAGWCQAIDRWIKNNLKQ